MLCGGGFPDCIVSPRVLLCFIIVLSFSSITSYTVGSKNPDGGAARDGRGRVNVTVPEVTHPSFFMHYFFEIYTNHSQKSFDESLSDLWLFFK
jgi:hypothetical protein